MDNQTIHALNALNQEFYRLTVEDFDESRGRPWPGWLRLLPHIEQLRSPLRVLDVGCGNGRFGRFLTREMGNSRPIAYHGIDNTPALLDAARTSFATMRILPDARLDMVDIVNEPLPEAAYDLVALFGVLHHVPGTARRQRFLESLGNRVAVGGILVFTAWCFAEYERFLVKAAPWPDNLAREAGDFLLDWRRGHPANAALRYCHHIDETEHRSLMLASRLEGVEAFRADGHTHDINRYAILQRPGQPL